jgi:hypothetical protein|tara:strand:- start:1448 stop:1627 length:180 start_codon:yes stop_codon:yes gene_type:complete
LKFIKKIIEEYDLNDEIKESMINELEKQMMDWWKIQANEYSKMLLIKENRIQFLEGRKK